ncbi:phage tail protein [Sphingomonas sp. LY54]|uniref:phage tail protein n=1 Tax=Sphingomonas sp. LY54 TaxID=3095343 RepID=UPI002D78DF3E|nr:phage tail protein [Sphingomonas sp. LY54]WRP29541.1 phage tail protein [Sphingomonas sp. LY54]
MATLVLTAVGGAVGGPVGAAIGAILGQQIDGRLFAPKGRHGPRLGDLAVQTSSYGSELPKIFGMMRVAGTVIWATDLQEHKRTSGGTKGRPKTTDYSYTASFAVALSARPIKGVRRIWAEGKLLRGAGGDFKSATGYRLYLGTEDQEVDPLIAAIEGAGQAPAYRGLAYAVFEDMQLEDFGNRIPSLTFEVEADSGPVSVGVMAGELSAGAIEDGGTPHLSGFAAGGDSVRAVLETLAQAIPLSLRGDASALSLVSAYEAPILVDGRSTGATSANGAGGAGDVSQRAMGGLTGEVSVAYHDPARDYQAGLQRATRGTAGQPHERLALPATLSAGAAKAIAEQRLSALWAGRTTATQHLSWNWLTMRPGACVRLSDQPGLWKIERWTLDRMVVSLGLVRVGEGVLPAPAAEPGRAIGHPDLHHGPTSLLLLDLPPVSDSALTRPQLAIAAAGGEG